MLILNHLFISYQFEAHLREGHQQQQEQQEPLQVIAFNRGLAATAGSAGEQAAQVLAEAAQNRGLPGARFNHPATRGFSGKS